MLVDRNGKFEIIDFGDSGLGPAWYDIPSIVMELFQGDPDCLSGFFTKSELQILPALLVKGLAFHDFGPDMIWSLAQKSGEEPRQWQCQEDLRRCIQKFLTA